MAAIRELDRIAPFCLVAPQVLEGDDPAAAIHLGDDELGGLPLVEALRALLRNAPEYAREVRILPRALRRDWLTVGQEERGGGGELREPGAGPADRVTEMLIGNEPFFGVLDGGRKQLRPFPASVFLMRFPQAGNRCGDAGGQMPEQRFLRDVAGRVEIHVAGGGQRRFLSEIERCSRAVC